MASIISAGTTDSTSLNVSSDKTGILQLASNNATVAVTINTSQYVGIGDTNPQSSLTVNSTTNPQVRVAYTGVHTYGLKVSSGGNFSIQDTDASSTDRLTIDTSGNVGISSTPSAWGAGYPTLQVGGGAACLTGRTGTSVMYLGSNWYYDGTNNKYIISDSATQYYQSNGNHVWRYAAGGTAGATISAIEAMRIDTSGSVGIGQTSPSSVATKLAVKGNGTSTNTLFSFRNSADSNVLYVREDGWFNLGNASLSPYNNTTGNGANVYIATDSSLQRSTSSLKYKTDVVDARFGLADVLKLRAVNYKSKNPADGDKLFGGLIAEEVEEAGLTEFVIHAQDGTPDALNYSNMVSLAFKAIQELKAINDTQAETINALTARLEALENK